MFNTQETLLRRRDAAIWRREIESLTNDGVVDYVASGRFDGAVRACHELCNDPRFRFSMAGAELGIAIINAQTRAVEILHRRTIE